MYERIGPFWKPIELIGDWFRKGAMTGLGALKATLAAGEWLKLTPDRAAGQLLFETLFGSDEGTWLPVLQRAFHEEDPARAKPSMQPLRVRVVTSDPLLAGMPWRAAMWGPHLLIERGWTFEVSSDTSSEGPIEHRAPGAVLMVVPEDAAQPNDAIGAEDHLRELTETFEDLSPGFTASNYFRVAQTRAQLEARLAEQPQLIYFYGRGDAPIRGLRVRMGSSSDAWLSVSELASQVKKCGARAVFLNACWTARAGGHDAGALLAPSAPLVLASSTAGLGALRSRRFALRWLRAWLGKGLDPVEAAHDLIDDADRKAEWAGPHVYARYQTWTTIRAHRGAARKLDRAEDWFDRDKQRSLLAKHISELTQNPKQRVEAFIAFAAPGNALERLPQQVIDFVERDYRGRIQIPKPLRVQLPAQRGDALTTDVLEQDLLVQIGKGPGDDLRRALTERAPRPQGDAERVLWIDWGVLRGQASYANKLSKWLEFARDRLAPACVEGSFRVVISIALEAAGDPLKELRSRLPSLRSYRDFRTDAFRCVAVEQLDNGSSVDILDFIDQHGCDPRLQDVLAGAIFVAADGRYEETTALLREGLATGWHALKARLGAGGGAGLLDM